MTSGIDIHVDSCFLGGVLYLNDAQHCEGGTSVFRHRRTGLLRFPNEEQRVTHGLPPDEHVCLDYFNFEEGKDRSQWQEVTRVEMRPNRLVLLAGGLFHAYTHAFGHSLDDGRLVQLFFLNPSAPEPAPSTLRANAFGRQPSQPFAG